MSLLERQKEFVGWLTKGFPEFGLAGLSADGGYAFAGNGSVENNMLPMTAGQKDHGSDGVLQWRLDRLNGPKGLKGWAADRGMAWDTLRAQAAFTLWELRQPSYKQLSADLRAGKKSLDELTADVCWKFERPSPQYANLSLRQQHARSVKKIMEQEAVPPVLEPVVNGPGSTLLGLLCTLLAWLKFDAVDPDGWLSWAILGFTLVFLIGGKREGVKPRDEEEDSTIPPPKQEKSMDLTLVPKVLEMVVALVPVLEKAFADLPKIREDIAEIRAALHPAGADPATSDALERVKAMIEKLAEMHDVQTGKGA